MIRRPSFGDYLRHLRKSDEAAGFPFGRPAAPRQRLGRTQLAASAGISVGYLNKLEQGYADHPSAELVNRLADALGVTAVERQHLHDLVDYQHSPAEAYDSRSPERRPVITDIQQEAVDNLYPHPAGYVDETWAVLYANNEYCRIYRRLCEIGNVLIWFFGEPQSRQIMVEWEIEARLTVAWVRAHMVRRPGDKAFDDLLEELSRFPDFMEMWQRQEILMGRHTPYMRVRDLDNGKDLTLLAQVYRGPDPTEAVQLYLGIRTDSVDSLDLISEAIAKRPT